MTLHLTRLRRLLTSDQYVWPHQGQCVMAKFLNAAPGDVLCVGDQTYIVRIGGSFEHIAVESVVFDGEG